MILLNRTSLMSNVLLLPFHQPVLCSYSENTDVIGKKTTTKKGDFAVFSCTPSHNLQPRSQATSNKLELPLWNLHGCNSVTLLLTDLLQVQHSHLVPCDTLGSSTQKIPQRNDICRWSQSPRFHPNHQPERWETRRSRNIDCSNSKGQKITTSISAASCELRLHSTAGNSLGCVWEVLLMRFTQREQGRGNCTAAAGGDSAHGHV